MLIRPILTACIGIRAYLHRYMPTNILLSRLRTRRGLKWGIPAMPRGVVYLGAAALATTLIERGAPGWINLLVLLFIWNGLKFLWNGPISLLNLARVRWAEHCLSRDDAATDRQYDRPTSAATPTARYGYGPNTATHPTCTSCVRS